MKEKIKTSLSLMMMGALIMVGMKMVEFAVGMPDSRILVCFNGNFEVCRAIDDLATEKLQKTRKAA